MKPDSKTPLNGQPVQRTSSLFGHAIIFILVPWLMFVGTLGSYFQWYHMPAGHAIGMVVVWSIVAAELLFSGILLMSRKAWVRQLGQMTVVVVWAGVFAGLFNEFTNLVYYHKYLALNEYSNVLPTASINTILDGGVLYFSSTTTIDTQKAVAFKSFTSPGTTFCTAPVLDSTFTPTTEIGVWAVGTNCCGQRASFYCDDVDKADSKSAMVLLPTEEVLPGWLISLGFGPDYYADYLQAIKLSSAVYGTAVAAEVRLVRWVADTQDFIANYRRAGIKYISDAATLVLILLIVSVVLLVASGHQV